LDCCLPLKYKVLHVSRNHLQTIWIVGTQRDSEGVRKGLPITLRFRQNGMNSLHMACWCGHVGAVTALLERKAGVASIDQVQSCHCCHCTCAWLAVRYFQRGGPGGWRVFLALCQCYESLRLCFWRASLTADIASNQSSNVNEVWDTSKV
jgi:hypothetical protein